MNEYILFMHDDVADRAAADDGSRWAQYISGLHATGQFDGGSSIGGGALLKKQGAVQTATTNITGYMRIRAESLEAAQQFLIGNPTYEAGGTVEVRELERT